MQGRKPKPIERQIAEGDPRKHGVNKLQERLEGQVTAQRGLPSCPQYLGKVARQVWNFWKLELESMAIDFRPDAMMLEAACVSYEIMVEAYDTLGKQGHQVEEPILDSEGEQIGTKIRNHPALARLNTSQMRLRAFCSEFGLSPVSRMRLTTAQPDAPGESLEELLAMPRLSRPKISEKQDESDEEKPN